jgi:GNAT superfamily N-acetyltransferase
MLEIIRTSSDNADFIEMVVLLDKDLQIRDGEDHAFYAQFNKMTKVTHAIVAYIEGKPAGTGALREYSSEKAEIKRMFVKPEYRRQGIAAQILSEVEIWAKELNYSTCILETGKNQPEAIAMYQKAGYIIIPNYGQYQTVENSVCMKKNI